MGEIMPEKSGLTISWKEVVQIAPAEEKGVMEWFLHPILGLTA